MWRSSAPVSVGWSAGLRYLQNQQTIHSGAEDAGDQKGRVPAVVDRDPGDDERRQNGAEICAGVEDAGGQRALALREPLGDGLDGGREVAGFAKAEAEARNAELKHRVGQRVAHGGEAPDGHDDHVADARADLVDEPSGDQQAERIGELKGVHDVAVVQLRSCRCCAWRVGLRIAMTWRSM